MNYLEIEKKARELRKKIAETKPVLDIKGTTYYVSADGDDNNDGLSPETAWKTLDGPYNNSDKFKPGDAVLFRCGDIFRAVEVRSRCILMKEGVTYSSFGDGPKPKLYGTFENAALLNWKKEGDNLYSLELGHKLDVGAVCFDEGKEWGFKLVKGRDVSTTPQIDLEFYHDIAEEKLYLCSEKGSPIERWSDIEVCPRTHIFGRLQKDVVIDGLNLKYAGGEGIGGGTLTYPGDGFAYNYVFSGFTVRNCEFGWMGGSLMGDVTKSRCRYGNGFGIWGGIKDLLIENCYFYQCFDAAITQQFRGYIKNDNPVNIEDTVIRGCLFENNTYDYEYWLTEYTTNVTSGGEKNKDSKFRLKNLFFEDNICRLNGYGWGNQRPDRTTPACLKSWTHQNMSENFVVKNNIFDRADYYLLEIIACEDKYVPTLIGNTYCQYLGKGLINSQGKPSMMTHEVARTKKFSNCEEDAQVCVAKW